MSLRRFFRRVIPKEIREPISKVTENIEDAVRPVTDPVRKFVSKAVPKELKPFLSSGIAIATGAFGGPAGAFLRTAVIDAMLQKAMMDPDAEDTGISLAQSLMAGAGGGLKAAASSPIMVEGTPGAGEIQVADLDFGDKIRNLRTQAGQLVDPFLAGPGDVSGLLDLDLKEGVKQVAKYSTGLGTVQVPQLAEDIKKAAETEQDAMAASEAATKANYDELQRQRVASMLGSFERAGFEPEETQREIEEEGLTVSLADVQDYFNQARQFVARGGRIGFNMGGRGFKDVVEDYAEKLTGEDYIRFIELPLKKQIEEMKEAGALRDDMARGGRIGFQDGSQEGPMTMEMGIGRYIEEEKIRRKMLDRIQRMMGEKEFNMQQDLPGPMRRNLNMLNPFDKDPTGQQAIFDMKNRYMDTMDTMREQGINRAKDFNKILEQMPAPKQDFESYVNMIDKNFPARNNTEGRQFANQGGRMTPEGDPISPDVPKGMQMDLRGGGFIPLGTKPRADDVPAMVGKNEFVLNDRAVSGIGKMLTGNPDPRAGARALYELQENMEAMV